MSMSPQNQNSSQFLDYRDSLIAKRLDEINRVILVGSGKGGVGKSLVSSTMGLLMSRSSFRTGLLDLDLHGPSSCHILKLNGKPAEEMEGLVPPSVLGLEVMSVDLFAQGRPLPLTGMAKQEVIREVLALTAFKRLDYLIVDLPPGTGDELLTIAKHTKTKAAAIIVTTPSKLSLASAKRVSQILRQLNIPIMGFIINMVIGMEDCKEAAREAGAPLLGTIKFDPEIAYRLEDLGPENILRTRFAANLKQILHESGFLVEKVFK